MKNSWILTFTGKKFFPLDPKPEDICIEDIAHALALTCRYNGHSREFYSVAQHAEIMSYLPGDPRWLLMHDAAEAYLSDVPRPIKPMLPEFRTIEDTILAVIGGKYGLGDPDHKNIKHADMVMLATEKRDVLLPCPDWPLILPDPLPLKINPWPWQIAEEMFLDRVKELKVV
jgi:hypothetical protein